MTKIIPDELPSSAETTKGKGQPSPAGHLDDDGHKIFQHVFVTSFMFVYIIAFALLLWSELGHWYYVIFTTITFLYSTVMSHLWLIKRRDQNKTQEPETCELSAICTRAAPKFMLVATGIMLISLGVAIFVFRPDWNDLAFVAFTVSSSTAVMLIYLKLEEIERKSSEKFNNASHPV